MFITIIDLKKMKIKWRSLLFNILIGLALEIAFTYLNFDDLADYSEYILENKKTYVHQIYENYSNLEIDKFFAANKIFYSELILNSI